MRNLREPVLFSTAVQRLLEDGHDTFLEISPHPILLSAVQQGIHHFGPAGAVLPSLRREEEEHAVMLGSLGALYHLGYSVDWSRIYPSAGRCVRFHFIRGSASVAGWSRRQVTPTLQRTNLESRSLGPRYGKHPLLGRHFKSAHPAETHFWEVALDKRALPYLEEHRIQGAAVLPASLYLEMALAAAREAFAEQSFVLKDIEFHRALFLPETGTRTTQVILRAARMRRHLFTSTVARQA